MIKVGENSADMPNGWILSKLADICDINPRIRLDSFSGEEEVTFLPMKCVQELTGNIDLAITRKLSQVRKGYTSFIDGDLIFAKITPCMENGKLAIVHDLKNGIGFGSTEFHVIRFPPSISNRFFFFYFSREEYRKDAQSSMTGTAGQLRVPSSYLHDSIIPLPPLSEQHRIVAKIEELFSRLDAGIQALQKAKAQLKRYRQAVLKAAVEGRLTEEWREEHPEVEPAEQQLERIMKEHREAWENELHACGKDPHRYNYRPPEEIESSDLPKLPNGWVWATTDQLASIEKYSMAIGPFGSNLKVVDYRTDGVPLIFVKNIRSGKFDGPGTWFVSKEKAEELKAHFVRGGDILITKMGDPPGDARIYPEDMPPAIITADCIKWQLSSLLQKKLYFLNAVNSILVKKQIIKVTKGVAQQKISLDRFKRIGIPMPPQSEQVQIVKIIELLSSITNETEKDLTQSIMLSTSLRQSILKRAFEGKLIPQDRNDEPASVLLERIRAERARKTQGLKSRSKRRKIKDVKQSMLL